MGATCKKLQTLMGTVRGDEEFYQVSWGLSLGAVKKEYELLMGLVDPPGPLLCNEIITLLDNTEPDW